MVKIITRVGRNPDSDLCPFLSHSASPVCYGLQLSGHESPSSSNSQYMRVRDSFVCGVTSCGYRTEECGYSVRDSSGASGVCLSDAVVGVVARVSSALQLIISGKAV